MVMESDPFMPIETMTTVGIAVCARKGFIYCCSEYPEKQQQGHELGWTGHGKTPEEVKAESGRNETEGEVKKP